jgi:AAA+ superfamily predicted ATPase
MPNAAAATPLFDPHDDARGRVGEVIGRVAARILAIRGGGPPTPGDSGPLELAPLPAASRLASLAQRAALAGPGLLLLRILVAAESDPMAYRALQRLGLDGGRGGIEVQALVTIAEYLGEEASALLAALGGDGLLAGHGLVGFQRDEGPLLSRRVTVPPRLLAYLRGDLGAPPPPLAIEPAIPLAGVVAADGVVARARGLLRDGLWLHGPRGVGKRTLLAALCGAADQALLCVDHRDLASGAVTEALGLAPSSGLREVVRGLWREALLAGAIVCIANVAEQPSDPPRAVAALHDALVRTGLPFVVTSVAAPLLGDFDLPPRLLAMPSPGTAARSALWCAALPGCERIEEVGARFRLPPGRIVRVADAARAACAADARAVTPHDLNAAVSAEIAQKVTLLGTRIETTQTWDDLVLPPTTIDAMREIVSRARHRHQVLQGWGFERKLTKGLGLSALFSGPPGTGKTMVAGIIARELALELYQIDLSRIVSKYVGETEKNLSEVFEGADWGNVLLLFDEADSLFSKRTEVKSSNDRFSNMEVNYLLQRLERFEGVSILTTNLESSIDPAFKRRFTFRVDFPVPDVGEREELWRRMLPREAATDGALDCELLAERYQLTGGNIRNAMLRAAFLAAGEGRGIGMEHVFRAVALEYRDAGQISIGGRLNQ